MEIQSYKEIEIFKKSISTFKETSRDTDSQPPTYMTDSEVEVINFDKVKERYTKELRGVETPCSVDALYIDKEDNIFLIEFKNGKIDSHKKYAIYNKIYDSLLIFNDIIKETVSFCRENVSFILVYNGNKVVDESAHETQEDSSKIQISKFFHKKAKKKFVQFGLQQFERLYFKEVFTYTESEFNEMFLSRIE